jgi:hypothetical protein
MATKSEVEKNVSILIGNLMPSQTALIELSIVFSASRVVGSAYEFVIPTYCLPNYMKHKTEDGKECQVFTFSYNIEVRSP